MSEGIPTQAEYEIRARREALSAEPKLKAASKEDTRTRADIFKNDLRDPALIAERVGWLLIGNYGFGQMQWAKEVRVENTSPRVAIRRLVELIGIFEWQCTRETTKRLWGRLPPAALEALFDAVEKELEELDASEKADVEVPQ